jgi:hypothetical protein
MSSQQSSPARSPGDPGPRRHAKAAEARSVAQPAASHIHSCRDERVGFYPTFGISGTHDRAARRARRTDATRERGLPLLWVPQDTAACSSTSLRGGRFLLALRGLRVDPALRPTPPKNRPRPEKHAQPSFDDPDPFMNADLARIPTTDLGPVGPGGSRQVERTCSSPRYAPRTFRSRHSTPRAGNT